VPADVVVAGQLARDLVLVVNDVPEAGQSGPVRERREMLGGKGANQAVAVAQLGLRPALIAVAGDGLITDIVDAAGHWRYLEDLPPSVLLSESDVRAAARLFDGARWASVQLQDPEEAARLAVAAAGLAVGHPGGRPELSWARLKETVARE
jgi:ribokinase